MTFEAILSEQQAKPKSLRRSMLILSVGLHAAALLAGAVHSIWRVEEMPMPSIEVLLTPAPPPEPPPPPPAPARSKSAATKAETRPAQARPQELVVPEELKKEPQAQAEQPPTTDQGSGEVGQLGGVSGGVPGGVVGGAVGALHEPPRLPPAPTGPRIVSAKIARGQLLIDPNAERYRVKLPPALARTGDTYVAMLRVCVSAQGKVSGVTLLKGAGTAIDRQFPTVLGRWRYRPLLADGNPMPFCYLLRYEVTGRE